MVLGKGTAGNPLAEAKAAANEYLARPEITLSPIGEIVDILHDRHYRPPDDSRLSMEFWEMLHGLWERSSRDGVWQFIQGQLLTQASDIHRAYLAGEIADPDRARTIESALRLMANLGDVVEKRYAEAQAHRGRLVDAQHWAARSTDPFTFEETKHAR